MFSVRAEPRHRPKSPVRRPDPVNPLQQMEAVPPESQSREKVPPSCNGLETAQIQEDSIVRALKELCGGKGFVMKNGREGQPGTL